MPTRKTAMLKAVEHNWGLTGPGDWSDVTWKVFWDGSYKVTSRFRPTFEQYEEAEAKHERPKPFTKSASGTMDSDAFEQLKTAMACDPWRDPAIEVFACDGVAWEIESYHEDGSIDKTSGKMNYIYGHRTLETIVHLLPATEGTYNSAAFISVQRKDG